ncbi:peptidase inhibitor family I36 protein [Streptomyces beigongshangae]|uniref:peptidase inhibitor family I36 protein n=1 Tax=Streptomyces beigongshangae TaxID=2841597 RepID=UPI001C84ED0A|nr:peptidase inhibitor family I36 protein [Streptomyces sp. REN17]
MRNTVAHRIGVASSAIGIAAASMMFSSSTASAATYSCPVDYVCVYDNDAFAGHVYAFPAANGYYEPNLNMDPPKWLSGVYLNDHISSIINNTRHTASFHKDANYKGGRTVIPPKSWNSKLSTTGFDNSISSFSVDISGT